MFIKFKFKSNAMFIIRSSFTFSNLLIITLLIFSCDTSSNYAEISFEKESYDFKFITHRKPVEAIFKFVNSGKHDLLITDIKTSCGCTIPNWFKEKIKPGKKGEVKIIYDAERLGRFNKTIVVFYNGEKKSKTIEIKGFVEYNEK